MTSCVCIFNENRQRCTGCMTIEIATDDMQLICLFSLCGYSALCFSLFHDGGYKIHIQFNSRRKTVNHAADASPWLSPKLSQNNYVRMYFSCLCSFQYSTYFIKRGFYQFRCSCLGTERSLHDHRPLSYLCIKLIYRFRVKVHCVGIPRRSYTLITRCFSCSSSIKYSIPKATHSPCRYSLR